MAIKIGKISSIKKNYANGNSLEAALSQKGYDRFPGTYSSILPYKEQSGKYRTGLDPEAPYLMRLSEEEKKLAIEDINEARERLEKVTGLDLSPRSDYYNYAKGTSDGQPRVKLVKLYQGDNIFSFSNARMEITYRWASVHPTIASSMEAYKQGKYQSATQFFVNNDDIETEETFKIKVLVNKAVAKLETLNPEKRKKVARLLGMPVSENSKEMIVYNLLDSFIKQGDVKEGSFKGQDAIVLFTKFADMENQLLTLKDTVKQAIKHGIYKIKVGGRVFEGEVEVFKTEDELISYLYSDKGQEDLLALEDKLNAKKSTLVS